MKTKKILDATEIRKAEIINEATKYFAKYGYHHTTLDEVAGELGIRKATIYYYFRSKEEILRTILKESMNSMDELLELEKSSLPPREKLHLFIRNVVEYCCNDAELTKLSFEQMMAIPQRTRNAIIRKQKRIYILLQNIISQGIEEGNFSVKDVGMASHAIIGICSWTYQWYKPDGRLTPEQISKMFINILENGLLKK